MTKTKKQDFIEIQYTGSHDGKPFDSNIIEDLKKINSQTKEAEKIVVAIGEKMVLPGLDKALEDKELNKEYEVHVPPKDGFGPRNRELVKTIPLSVFTKHKINPVPGATFMMDNVPARIITVSGARVVTDFNNPLAGKDLDYKFKITRIVTEEKEKIESLFKFYIRAVPEFEIQDKKIIVKGPEPLKHFIETFKDKFKKLLGKEMEFKLQAPEAPKEKDNNNS